ncbi:MAG TPA: HAMP domain-containing protein [Anaeromyxobacteraceae bacterium]
MSISDPIKKSLAAKVALLLGAVVLVLTTAAAAVITLHQRTQMEQATLAKARNVVALAAQQYGDILDKEIDAGALTVNDAFDRNYVLIKGYEWGSDPKFHSRFDSVTDRAVLELQDQVLEDSDFIFAIGVDDNGYIPTHDSKFTQPITGIKEKDLAGNRTKRKADYEVGLKAARNLEPTLVQDYKRNTGEMTWDVSAPLFVKGKHWGAFRVGVSLDRLVAQQRSLVLTLLALFAVFFIATTGTMYAVLKRAMRPVVELTAAAEQIGLGEALDKPIESDAVDEIGQLTTSIERLRSSMQAAMQRLGH